MSDSLSVSFEKSLLFLAPNFPLGFSLRPFGLIYVSAQFSDLMESAEMIVMGRNSGAQKNLEFRLYAKLILCRQEFCQKKVPRFPLASEQKRRQILRQLFSVLDNLFRIFPVRRAFETPDNTV